MTGSSAYKVPSSADLIADYGVLTNLRCSCCGLLGSIWEIPGYRAPIGSLYLCSWCDVEIDRRKR
jgi:hypothetical protein